MTTSSTVSRVELAKIGAQRRTVIVSALCFLGPIAAGITFRLVSGVPKDTPFGRYIHESGYALPLVVLGFAATWALPLLAAAVAGDVFSSEDTFGTWGLMLSRSASRAQVFIGKTEAAAGSAVGFLGALAAGSIVGGFLLAGGSSIVGLGGQEVRPSQALLLVLASWASEIPAVLAWTALACFLSVVTRNSVVGIGGPLVLGLVCTLVALLDRLGVVRALLPTTPMFSWRGFWEAPVRLGSLWQGSVVSLAYAALFTALAAWTFLRRDESA